MRRMKSGLGRMRAVSRRGLFSEWSARQVRSAVLAAVLAFAWLLTFSQAGSMQTRMAIAQLYAMADICVGSAHLGAPGSYSASGAKSRSSGAGANSSFLGLPGSDMASAGDDDAAGGAAHAHHCAACLPALDSPPIPVSPAYASWAERLSHEQRAQSKPSTSLNVLPRPFGHGPPHFPV